MRVVEVLTASLWWGDRSPNRSLWKGDRRVPLVGGHKGLAEELQSHWKVPHAGAFESHASGLPTIY